MARMAIEASILTAMIVTLTLAVARADVSGSRREVREAMTPAATAETMTEVTDEEAPPAPKPSHPERACTPRETWTFGTSIADEKRADFNAFLKQTMKPVQAFAEGLAFRSIAQTPEGKLFGEYWAARALFDAKLVHLAFDGFVAVAARPHAASLSGVQLAAVDCLVQITQRYPSLVIPAKVSDQFWDLRADATTPAEKEILWLAGGQLLRQQLADGAKPDRKSLEHTLTLVHGSGAYEPFHRALAAASRRDHNQVIMELSKFLETQPMPPPLKRFVDPAHILIARALYSMQQFDRAASHLKQVTKASNELVNSLSELSWAFLMNDRYSEAIGTSMNLQAGSLRRTFAPEAGMVMAMSLNELCQYPESVYAISALKHAYDQSYRWLSTWRSARDAGQAPNLYTMAVQFLRKQSKVPERVASEWVRSPLVISSQEEINLIFDEGESSGALGRTGVPEQRRIAEQIIRMARDLKPKFQQAKMRRQGREALPPKIGEELAALKREVGHFKRLQHAAPIWRAVLAHAQKKAPVTEKTLVTTITHDIENRTQRMLDQMEEIAENVQMIEVEIYNGASQDIIWQNAHPDYKAIARKMKDDTTGPAERVWDWGRALASAEGDTEIWEDELGSFKANLYNNCSSKDRYLALKLNHRKR